MSEVVPASLKESDALGVAQAASRDDAGRAAPPPGPAGSRPRAGNPLAVAGLALAVVAIAIALWFWQRAEGTGREAARRLQASDQRVAQLEAAVRQSQDVVRELQARSAVLESKLTEALGQQAQLEKMYRDIAQDSIGSVLADVENAVAIASQQLLVSGNVQGALVALQDADGRLKRINQPEALGLRRLIARDIDRLKAVPNVDVVGLALRLDSVAAGLDQLPLVASLSSQAAPRVEAPAPEQKSGPFSLQGLASTGRKGWEALLGEIGQLFRVNRVDASDALLLAPGQQYFVRENLRLALLSARLSLLARSEPMFRADVERSLQWLATYYDRQSKAVANASASLKQLQGSRIAAELPSLGDTLAAVRTARSARDAKP